MPRTAIPDPMPPEIVKEKMKRKELEGEWFEVSLQLFVCVCIAWCVCSRAYV